MTDADLLTIRRAVALALVTLRGDKPIRPDARRRVFAALRDDAWPLLNGDDRDAVVLRPVEFVRNAEDLPGGAA